MIKGSNRAMAIHCANGGASQLSNSTGQADLKRCLETSVASKTPMSTSTDPIAFLSPYDRPRPDP
jgi:hypothetical protein